jgi:SnoaL-like domain
MLRIQDPKFGWSRSHDDARSRDCKMGQVWASLSGAGYRASGTMRGVRRSAAVSDYEVERSFIRHLDARAPEALSEVFDSAAILSSPGATKTGRAGIAAYYRERFSQFGPSQHFITLVADRSSPNAERHSDWYFMSVLTRSDGIGLLAFGTYAFDVGANARIRQLAVRVNSTFEIGRPVPFSSQG